MRWRRSFRLNRLHFPTLPWLSSALYSSSNEGKITISMPFISLWMRSWRREKRVTYQMMIVIPSDFHVNLIELSKSRNLQSESRLHLGPTPTVFHHGAYFQFVYMLCHQQFRMEMMIMSNSKMQIKAFKTCSIICNNSWAILISVTQLMELLNLHQNRELLMITSNYSNQILKKEYRYRPVFPEVCYQNSWIVHKHAKSFIQCFVSFEFFC